MKPFLIRWFITTIAVLAVTVIPFIGVRADQLESLLAAGLLLGFFNAFLRPALLLLSLPLILITGGLFFFFLNAITLYIVGHLIPGFYVESFWAALFGSILIGFFSWVLGLFLLPGSSGGSGNGWFRVHTFRGEGGTPRPHHGFDLRGGQPGESTPQEGETIQRPRRDGRDDAFGRDAKPVQGRVIE